MILPRYACIPQKYQDKMIYRGEFYMDLGRTGREYYVGIMEYICDGVVYDFIDNQEFFSSGNPYINLVDDIPKYCFFSKAALAALNFMNWIPDIIHCHDWQTALVPIYLRTLFQDSPVGRARSILTIHNLRFQGIYNIPTIQYWSGLPDSVFNMGALKQDYNDAICSKAALPMPTGSPPSAAPMPQEIQTSEYGKLWKAICATTAASCGALSTASITGCGTPKQTRPGCKLRPGECAGPQDGKQAGPAKRTGARRGSQQVCHRVDLPAHQPKGPGPGQRHHPPVLDGNTQVVVLGTGDKQYEDTFRYYEDTNRGTFAACIQYDEARAHRIYAGATLCWCPPGLSPAA